MRSVVIYTDDKNTRLKDLCERTAECEALVKPADEIKNIGQMNVSAAVIDIPAAKLKDLSMIMKFTVPSLLVCGEIPENISIRGDAYDFILKSAGRYEFGVRLNNLLKIKELKERISDISQTDELTGLHNRRFFQERLEAEISRAKRYGGNVSVILFDIDFFKVVNDMYGYECGDVLLKQIAEMLSNFIRKEDIASRYGDEEFLIALPNTPEDKAYMFAERFRREVEKMSFIPSGEDERHPVKISGGIASFPYMDKMEESANSLVRYAEHALYNAKKRGKNRVVLFSQVNLDF